MSAILLEGNLVHYEVLGRGRPVIFLHGWLGSWRYWISAMQVTSTSYRAYALDLWGYGDSPHVPERYSIPQQAMLVRDFLQELGIGKVALVGHGLGGLVALQFALQQPDSVDRLLLSGVPTAAEGLHPRLLSEDLPTLSGWLAPERPELAPVHSELPKMDLRAVRTAVADLQSAPAFFRQVRDLLRPCLFVEGQDDPLWDRKEDILETMRYNFHQIVLEEAAHYPMLEQSARFNRLLSDFLALESGDSPRELQLKEEWKRRVR